MPLSLFVFLVKEILKVTENHYICISKAKITENV